MSLPVETLDATRPGLEDLRLFDDSGNELPYLIERPVPATKSVQSARAFEVSLNPAATIVTLETGFTQPLEGVTLESPAGSFIKSVDVEGSADGKRWRMLTRGQPIFRQPGGAGQLRLAFPEGAWRWLRLTVDDRRSPPVPFTGARVHAAAAEPAPVEILPVLIAARDENPGETRLTLKLNAANLDLTAIQVQTPEPLFTRQVTVAAPQISEDAIHEETLAQGLIYRVAVEGEPDHANLTVPLERQVPSRELLLLIKNRDSPPLPITAVRAERRPVYVVFFARQPGAHHLLTGNNRCAAPSYDLAALGADLKTVAVLPVKFSPLSDTPNYRPPEVLLGIDGTGAALDVSVWKFRKAVKLARAGAQQIELDPEVLSHAQPGFQDLRLLRGGKQLPYILERTSISRLLLVTATNDAQDPKLSRWVITLSHSGLPVNRLSCRARTALFQRDITLWEEVADERGGKRRRTLGRDSWVQTPQRASKDFILRIDAQPGGNTLFLETDNGDNPSIELQNFQMFYPVTRVLFKAQPGDELFLHYGNLRAAPPRYDLSLVAGQLVTAGKSSASLGPEEQLRKSSWAENHTPGKGGVLFWGILALVVMVLLIIVARLLPKSPGPTKL